MSGLGSIGSYVRNRNCDTEVEVDGLVFGVHKVVLREHSYFFKKKIAQYGNQTKIVVDNVNPQGMEWCIEFMYTGECPPKYFISSYSLTDISSAIQTANFLQMENFKEKCLEYMQRHLTPDNCLETVNTFRKYDGARVQSAQTYVKDNFAEVISRKDFLLVEDADFFQYISESKASSKVMWKSITSWIEYKPQRKRHLYKTLCIIFKSGMDILPILLQVIEYHLLHDESSCMDRIFHEIETRELQWIRNMTADSSVKILKLITSVHFPNQRVAERFKRTISEYLACHINEAKSKYCELSFDEFRRVISCIKSKTEVQWTYIICWINYDDTRTIHLLDLIKIMDRDTLTPNFISNHMRDIIKSSNDCLNYILDHLLNVVSVKQCKSRKSLGVYDSKTQILTLLDTSTNTYAEVKAPTTKHVSRVTSVGGELFLNVENILYKLTFDGTWLKLSDIPDYSQTWTQFTACKNQLYIITNKTLFQYDISEKMVSYHAGCGLGNGFTSTSYDSCIYAVGGSNTQNRTKKYTPTNGWFNLPTLPMFTTNPALVYFKNVLYVMGGTYAGSYSNSVACFDDTTWTLVPNMLRRRSQFGAIVFEGKIVVMGGCSGMIMPFEDVEEYDRETNTWKQIGLISATKGVVSLGICEVDNTSVSFRSPAKGMTPSIFIGGRLTSKATLQ